MILGTYFLTYCDQDVSTLDPRKMKPVPPVFGSADDVLRAVDEKTVDLQGIIRLRRGDEKILTTAGRAIFNAELDEVLADHIGEDYDLTGRTFVNFTIDKKKMNSLIADLINQYGTVAVAQVLDVIKTLGFRYATDSGVTVGKNDIVIPPEKGEILNYYEGEVGQIYTQYDRGFITEGERHELVVEKWHEATDKVAGPWTRTSMSSTRST